MQRHHFAFSVLLLAFGICVLPGCKPTKDETELATAFPAKNLQIICPWGAGGGTDRISRFFANSLKDELGYNCIVVNRTGGSGAVGHRAGADADSDGHTIAMITAELSTMHQLGISDITFQDYQPLLQINGDPAAILVPSDSKYNSLESFLAAVKSNPGTLKMSGTATGGTWDLARVGLFQKSGLSKDDVIWVPTKGSAESIQLLLGGHLDAVCCSLPEAALQLNAGQLAGIAVMAETRDESFPDIPSAKEQGVDWVSIGWRGFATQKETPQHVVEKLQAAMSKIANGSEYKSFMNEQGFRIDIKVGEEFTTFLSDQDVQWKEVLKHYVAE